MKLNLWLLLAGWALPEHTGISDDLDVLTRALRPAPGKNLLCLSSYGAGEAALALAAGGADLVMAFDLEDAPMLRRLIALKASAAAVLDNDEYLALMGLRPATRSSKEDIIDRTLGYLSDIDYPFWAKHRRWLSQGLFFSNKQTFFIQLFFCLTVLLAPTRGRHQMFFSRSKETRKRLFRRYISRPMLKFVFDRLGARFNFFYPKAEWQHSDYPKVYNRNPFSYFEHLFGIGISCNPLFAHNFVNNGSVLANKLLPPHLRPQGYIGLRTVNNRVSVFPSSLKILPTLLNLKARSYHGAYLSNIIDYLGPDDRKILCRAMCKALTPGAPVLIYSSEAYDKVPPKCGLKPDLEASRLLAEQDRVRVYTRLGLYRVDA